MFDSELVDRVCNTLNIVLTNDGIYHADPVSNSSASFHLMKLSVLLMLLSRAILSGSLYISAYCSWV